MNPTKRLTEYQSKYPYPRRRLIRRILKHAISMAASVITDYRIEGQENLRNKALCSLSVTISIFWTPSVRFTAQITCLNLSTTR